MGQKTRRNELDLYINRKMEKDRDRGRERQRSREICVRHGDIR